MKIFSLYPDFFKFLERINSSSDKWSLYFDYYYQPHLEFLENYFSHFPLIDFSSLKQRVGAIKASDYSWLRHLISVCSPEKTINKAYKKCKSIVAPPEQPEVYLFIGFFSPDGFIMEFREKPVICFGLERFRDFRLFAILFAHEYAHFLMNLSKGEVPEGKRLKRLLVSEGIGTYFSLFAFPNHKLSDHFLFSRDTFNWCQAHESLLRDMCCSGKFSNQELIDFYNKGNPALNIPPRAGKYLGFQAVKRYLAQNREKDIKFLLFDKNSALSLEL